MKIIDLLAEIYPGEDFSNSQDLVGDGLLDSFGVFAFVDKMNIAYHISIQSEDIIKENFMNIEAIGKMLKSYGVKDAL